MKRPFKNLRPFGPLIVGINRDVLSKDSSDEEFVIVLNLGDVSDRGSTEAAQFVTFLRGGLRDQRIPHDTVPFGKDGYTDSTYRMVIWMEDKEKLDKDKLENHVNDRVGGMERPSKFRIRSIKVVPEKEFEY